MQERFKRHERKKPELLRFNGLCEFAFSFLNAAFAWRSYCIFISQSYKKKKFEIQFVYQYFTLLKTSLKIWYAKWIFYRRSQGNEWKKIKSMLFMIHRKKKTLLLYHDMTMKNTSLCSSDKCHKFSPW